MRLNLQNEYGETVTNKDGSPVSFLAFNENDLRLFISIHENESKSISTELARKELFGDIVTKR